MGNQETHYPLFISTNVSLNARENRRDNQETHSSGTPRAFPQVKKTLVFSLGERREEFRMETHCPLFISTNVSLNVRENRRGICKCL